VYVYKLQKALLSENVASNEFV